MNPTKAMRRWALSQRNAAGPASRPRDQARVSSLESGAGSSIEKLVGKVLGRETREKPAYSPGELRGKGAVAQ